MINQLVNQRYEVLEKVGDSSLFAVYKARDKAANRVVALKTVLEPYISDAAFMEGLRAGLSASAGLNHPHITHFYEFGEDGGTPYAVVEFVRGINLKERIRRIAPFTLSVAVDFACALAEALHYAHSMGQAHGDLRPQNIVISPEGALKVTDFGVQRAIARSPQAQADVLLRAAPYHAPELSMTNPGTVAGDLYALGAILYEMLTGTPLYAGESPEAIADQHAFAAVPSPRVINPGVPRSIEGIILKCLQKRSDQRYRSASELLTDLKAVRDALRFGKPLSWSPIDLDKAAEAPARPVNAPPNGARPLEPVAEVAASSQSLAMPSKNRLRAENERVSIYLRVAIGTVTAIIIAALIGFAGLWMSIWVTPKTVPVPQMVGKSIDDVRKMADSMKVRLIEHAVYTDKPRDVVYKTEPPSGTQTRQNHIVNVWYSNGPRYVEVPDVTKITREDAEQKLKDAGLTVGKITPEYSNTVQTNYVIRQTVSFKKRVFHDTAVDLVVSDGPKPDYAAPDNSADSGSQTDGNPGPDTAAQPDGNDTGSGDNTDNSAAANPPALSPDEQTHTFDRTISIPRDGKGSRTVRIEYKDKLGSPTAVIEEPHNEGDKINVSFLYYGKDITLTIFYDNVKVFDRTFDPQATLHQRVQ